MSSHALFEVWHSGVASILKSVELGGKFWLYVHKYYNSKV